MILQYIKDIIYNKEQDEILFNKYISKICVFMMIRIKVLDMLMMLLNF